MLRPVYIWPFWFRNVGDSSCRQPAFADPVNWSLRLAEAPPWRPCDSELDSSIRNIAAVKDQVGLDLGEGNDSVQYIIVDHVDRLSGR